jgi:hypothetical protein
MIYSVTVHKADGEILKVEPWLKTETKKYGIVDTPDKLSGHTLVLTEEQLFEHLKSRLKR